MAVASAGPYASHLHFAPDRYPCQHLITQVFTGRMPFLPYNQQRESATNWPTIASAQHARKKTIRTDKTDRLSFSPSVPSFFNVIAVMDNQDYLDAAIVGFGSSVLWSFHGREHIEQQDHDHCSPRIEGQGQRSKRGRSDLA